VKTLATVAGIGGAVAALWFAFQAAGDLYLTGFPDSHFTDDDKAVQGPKRMLLWTEVGFVPLFGVLWYFGTALGLDNGIGG
jgi:hypothetical protein